MKCFGTFVLQFEYHWHDHTNFSKVSNSNNALPAVIYGNNIIIVNRAHDPMITCYIIQLLTWSDLRPQNESMVVMLGL